MLNKNTYNHRRIALAECLDSADKRFSNVRHMTLGEAEVYLPYLVQLKKNEEEKCFRFYGGNN